MTFRKGQIISADLTVDNATAIRDFYKEVIGWEVEEMPLKDGVEAYNDYVVKDSEGNWVGGICHNRGVNQGIPPQWMVYVNVADVGESVRRCIELGGKIIRESRDSHGNYQYVMIQDPAGAILGIVKE